MAVNDSERQALTGLLEAYRTELDTAALMAKAIQLGWSSFSRYTTDFMLPALTAGHYFTAVEQRKLQQTGLFESLQAYNTLWAYNLDIAQNSFAGAMRALNRVLNRELKPTAELFSEILAGQSAGARQAYAARMAKLSETLAYGYPRAIADIEPEYGFHFERDDRCKIAETDRFELYQVLPDDPKIDVRPDGKPVLIIPPYVLGANILAFLPAEQRSYAHSFANQGIPTYVRLLKDIQTTEALQLMTGEDDARDTRLFCEAIKKRHGQAVTLNGYCQGGFISLCNLLSGELDGLVDAFISCVAPMDGTRSEGFKQFLQKLPPRFNDLAYGTKTLPNGNRVADGKLMGWVYKVKSIDIESPLAAFCRDILMLGSQMNKDPQGDQKSHADGNAGISKTAAALNWWLLYERYDLPLEITKMSFASYNTPIDEAGNLPVRLFNKPLNLKRLQEKGITWLICYGEDDNLVEQPTALAPRDWIDVEVTGFPKGHVAMATSWSHPGSPYALHTRFGKHNNRGPVRFQLDLEQNAASKAAAKKRIPKAAATV